jgi:hypothetical protein
LGRRVRVEEIALFEFDQLGFDAEFVENVAGLAGKSFQILGEVRRDVVGVGCEALEGVLGGIEELLLAFLLE